MFDDEVLRFLKEHSKRKGQSAIKVVKVDERAQIQAPTCEGDVGLNVAIIGVAKDKEGNDIIAGLRLEEDNDGTRRYRADTVLYDTGLVVVAPPGMHVEMLPRSSMGMSGYMLTNSIGLIDPAYRGTLKVALRRVRKDAPPIEFPAFMVQIVLRHTINIMEIEETTLAELGETERGDAGFGQGAKRKAENELSAVERKKIMSEFMDGAQEAMMEPITVGDESGEDEPAPHPLE